MWPVLLRVDGFSLYSFGFFLFLGFFLATFVVWKQARSGGLPEEKVFDVLFLTTFFSLLFGRLGYIFANWPVFAADYSRIVLFLKYPGLSFPVLFGTAVVVSALLAKSVGLEVLLLWDILALAAAFFAVFANFGCFLDGCFTPSLYLPLSLAGLALVLALVCLVIGKKFLAVADLSEVAKRHGIFFLCYLIFQLLSLLMTTWFTKNVWREVGYGLALFLVLVILFIRYKVFFKYVYRAVSQRRLGAN